MLTLTELLLCVCLDIINTIFWLLVVILLLLIILVALVGGMALRKWHCYFKRRQMRKIEDKKFQQKLSSVQVLSYVFLYSIVVIFFKFSVLVESGIFMKDFNETITN